MSDVSIIESERKFSLENQAYVQVTEGCDKFECSEFSCKSCKEFRLKDEKEQDGMVSFIIETNGACLCNGISPFAKDESLFLKIKNFDSVIKKYLNEDFNEDISRQDFPVIKSVICDEISFPLILTTLHDETMPFNYANPRLVDGDLYNLIDVTSKQGHLLNKIKQNFRAMAIKFLNLPPITRYHVRGIILLMCFWGLLDIDCIKETIKHINNFDHKADQYFWNALEELPTFIKRSCGTIISMLEMMLRSRNKNTKQLLEVLNIFAPFCKRVFSIRMSDPDIFVIKGLTNQITPNDVAKKIYEGQDDYSTNGIFFDRKFKWDVFQIIVKIRQFILERSMTLDHPFRRNPPPRNRITVQRSNITETALRGIEAINPNNLLLPFEVTFDGEEGADYGGLTREFFYKLSELAFSPDYGMFRYVNNQYYWFTVHSDADLSLYRLLGTVVALGVVNTVPIPIRFPLLMYKKLLGKKIILADLEEVDPYFVSAAKNMIEMKKNGQSIEDLSIFFTTTVEKYGQLEEEPIVEGGKEIPVTNDNLDVYISLYIQWFTEDSIEAKFREFSSGFFRVIPRNYISIFAPQDIDQLVSGDQKFDWQALKNGCQYSGYRVNSKVIQNFWDIFEHDFTDKDRRAFLKFVTGCDYAPIGGLANVHITIEKTDTVNLLPVAHTCMKTLTLPNYSKKDVMKKNLKIIIQHAEGFGFR